MSDIGDMVIFSGDWLAYPSGPDRRVRTDAGWIVVGDYHYRVGFHGRLCNEWMGGIECLVTRPVAEAIIVEQERLRADFRRTLEDNVTLTAPQRRARLNEAHQRLFFMGSTLMLDESGICPDDPNPFRRVHPDRDGLYNVGFGWCWGQVDPTTCDKIILGTQPVL